MTQIHYFSFSVVMKLLHGGCYILRVGSGAKENVDK